MDEKNAKAAARALRGEAWQSGGGIWLVICHRTDDQVVVISDDVIKVYGDREKFENDDALTEILLH